MEKTLKWIDFWCVQCGTGLEHGQATCACGMVHDTCPRCGVIFYEEFVAGLCPECQEEES